MFKKIMSNIGELPAPPVWAFTLVMAIGALFLGLILGATLPLTAVLCLLLTGSVVGLAVTGYSLQRAAKEKVGRHGRP